MMKREGMSVVQALQHPEDEENAELLEQVGADYNPEAFDMNALNKA